jgi:ubiquinone/menaquinone biosynthesis C-methylase UbiE
MTSGAGLSVFDFIDLAVLRLAKRHRQHRSGGANDAKFYDEFFTDYDAAVLDAGGDPRKNVRLRVVSEALARHVRQGKVLDVGCGVGDTLVTLASAGRWELFGVEYAASAARRAGQRLEGRATVQQASATELPFEDASFDGFTCIEVFEHIEDDQAAMREVARVLRPGACGVVTVPYRHWFPAYLELIGHHRHYTRSSLERALRDSGFRVVEWLPNYPRWHRAADLSYVLARGVSELGRATRGRRSLPHEVRLPLTDVKLFDVALGAIEPLRRLDAKRQPAELETTTSCVVTREG